MRKLFILSFIISIIFISGCIPEPPKREKDEFQEAAHWLGTLGGEIAKGFKSVK